MHCAMHAVALELRLLLSYLYNTHLHPIPPSAKHSFSSLPGTGGFHRLEIQKYRVWDDLTQNILHSLNINEQCQENYALCLNPIFSPVCYGYVKYIHQFNRMSFG